MKNTEKSNFDTLTVTADIHADGDVYVKGKDKKFHYIGCLGESSFGEVPDEYYLKIKKLI